LGDGRQTYPTGDLFLISMPHIRCGWGRARRSPELAPSAPFAITRGAFNHQLDGVGAVGSGRVLQVREETFVTAARMRAPPTARYLQPPHPGTASYLIDNINWHPK
jgi:hypothetical protein